MTLTEAATPSIDIESEAQLKEWATEKGLEVIVREAKSESVAPALYVYHKDVAQDLIYRFDNDRPLEDRETLLISAKDIVRYSADHLN